MELYYARRQVHQGSWMPPKLMKALAKWEYQLGRQKTATGRAEWPKGDRRFAQLTRASEQTMPVFRRTIEELIRFQLDCGQSSRLTGLARF